MKFSTNEDIEAPIDAVFEMLCDFESFERSAMRRGAEVQRIDQQSTPGVGMMWQAAFALRGKQRQMEVEMVTFDRPQEIVLESTSPGMLATTSFELIARSSTRVKVEIEVKPLNLSARLLVQSLKLAKNSLTKKFKLRVAEYAMSMEDRGSFWYAYLAQTKEALRMVHVLTDINMLLFAATANMAFALVLGAIIGSERQFRGRMAGLRTNALVVSGIGFLGAGIIFRDGFNVQGINTAATLWCSAAVGLICGSGHVLYAVALTSLIVFSNLGLRPVVRLLKKAAAQSAEAEQVFELTLVCQHDDEKDVRTILFGHLVDQGLTLRQIESHAGRDTVDIIAQVYGADPDQTKVEVMMGKIARACAKRGGL
ncbi:Protein MgtC [Nymphon striatum]|nr:Protein MgtC [Nymphon striatum]